MNNHQELVNILPATIQDCAGLAHVQVDSYRTAYAGIFPSVYLEHFGYEEQEQDWRDLLAVPSNDLLLVAATDAGEVVGYALGRPGLTNILPYDSELMALHVRRSYQRRGIGRRLTASMAQLLQQKGCVSLMLWALAENAPARALYERIGGQIIGEKKWGGNEEFGIDVDEIAYGWLDITILIY